MRNIRVFADPAALANAAADHIAQRAAQAIEARGRFQVALSGGSTPQATYSRLAALTPGAIDWSRVAVFWSDERCVPPDHPDSNYGASKRALLDHVPVPPAHVHRMAGERPPEEAALDYDRELARLPRCDLILLGLGMDGHTASIFPEVVSTVLAPARRERSVLAVHLASRKAWRLTMTPRYINSTREVLLLAFGADKASVVRDVLEGPRNPERLPSQLIGGGDSEVRWFLDSAAAAKITP